MCANSEVSQTKLEQMIVAHLLTGKQVQNNTLSKLEKQKRERFTTFSASL